MTKKSVTGWMMLMRMKVFSEPNCRHVTSPKKDNEGMNEYGKRCVRDDGSLWEIVSSILKKGAVTSSLNCCVSPFQLSVPHFP